MAEPDRITPWDLKMLKAQPPGRLVFTTDRTLGLQPRAQRQNPARGRRRSISRPGAPACGVVRWYNSQGAR